MYYFAMFCHDAPTAYYHNVLAVFCCVRGVVWCLFYAPPPQPPPTDCPIIVFYKDVHRPEKQKIAKSDKKIRRKFV